MTKAQDFQEWCSKTKINFKHEEHARIVYDFCKEASCRAEIELIHRKPWRDYKDIYDELTKVTFSDGSMSIFNYKGEGEEL